MSSRKTVLPIALVLLLAGSVGPARADVMLTPFLGITFGADTPSQQVNYGVSLAFLAGGIVGLELDAALTPNFFDSDSDALEDGNVSTVMANLMLAAPMQGTRIRPYLAAGAGIMHAKATSVGNVFELNDNSFGVNVGAGVMGFMRDNIGVRADIRYFRALQDAEAGDGIDLSLGALDFWRGTLGVTFRF